MENIKKYYENTENALPNPTVRAIIEMNIKPENAIDLGCGAGRDTVFLIKNDWKVLAIDREDTEKIISSKLNEEEIKNFRFKCQEFENIELEKNKLLAANFCISFCNKNYFNEFWNKITDSILVGGYFAGNFFGIHDSWSKIKNEMVFLTKEQVLNLFENGFEIIKFKEFEKDEKNGLGKMQHWHIYNVIAKKKN